MKTCERYEMLISALFDGEAERQDVIALLEHLPSCASCQRFLRGALKLQELADTQPITGEEILEFETSSATGALPLPALDEAATLAPRSPAAIHRLRTSPRWAWGIAAALLVAVALWVRPGIPPIAPGSTDSGDQASISVEPNTVHMTEERFVEMAVELLESDPRYQTEMLGILMRLERARVVEEGSTELAANRGEGMMSWDLGLESSDEELGTEGDLQIGIY